jgi:hypothetical protein
VGSKRDTRSQWCCPLPGRCALLWGERVRFSAGQAGCKPLRADLKALGLVGEPEVNAATLTRKWWGAPGTLALHFTAVATGQEALKRVNHRTWEVGVVLLKTYEVTIVVKRIPYLV